MEPGAGALNRTRNWHKMSSIIKRSDFKISFSVVMDNLLGNLKCSVIISVKDLK